jgi:hypothetical protein
MANIYMWLRKSKEDKSIRPLVSVHEIFIFFKLIFNLIHHYLEKKN